MNNFTKNLIYSLYIIGILCIVSVSILIIIKGEIDWEAIKNQITYNFYYGIPLSFVNGYFFDTLTKFIPWENKPKRRVWIGIVGSICLTMITVFTLNYILWVLIWGDEFQALFTERNRIFYLIAFIITLIISTIIHAVEFFKWAMREKLQNEKLRKEKLQMELNALKSQLDPHFLFNSFNVLSGMIDENPTKAQDMLVELSDIYRHVLDNRNENTNTIEEEVEFAKKYMSFQQARFENSIDLEIEIADEVLSKSIPSLSLQLLLENAIKHNAFSEENPLKIKLMVVDNKLVVINNKRPRKNLKEGLGMGLQNIKDRYQIISDSQIIIQDTDQFFKVYLPIIS